MTDLERIRAIEALTVLNEQGWTELNEVVIKKLKELIENINGKELV